jgi:trimeric autotransporter adhesin
MRVFIFSFFLFLKALSLSGQWINLGSGLNNPGRCMLFDSTSQSLIVGGNFDEAGGAIVNKIAAWNGINWNTIGNGAAFGAPVYSITIFQGHLYASSIFINNPTRQNWFNKWNGVAWDTISPCVNGTIDCFKENNGELYLGGTFHSTQNSNLNLLAKYDGTNLYPLPLPAQSYSVMAIEFYRGDMYIAGNFYDTLQQVNDLEMWNGTNFTPLIPNCFLSGLDYVDAMAVFNDELYIGGNFTSVNGDPENYIMRWDGMQFHDVGNGLNGPVYKMKTYNDGLYVSGVFSMAGQLPVPGIVKWNGNQWISLCDTFQSQGITDFIKINGDLYITGGIQSIDSLQVNYIAKLQGNLSTEELELQFEFSINECSTNNCLSIQIPNCNSNHASISLMDIQGRLLKRIKIKNSKTLMVYYFESLPSGLYLISLENEDIHLTKKAIIK